MAIDATKMAELYSNNSRELLVATIPTAETDGNVLQSAPPPAPDTNDPAVVADISREALAASRAAASLEPSTDVKPQETVTTLEQSQPQPPVEQQQPAYKEAQQSKIDMIV